MAGPLNMQTRFFDRQAPMKTLILVSQHDHCDGCSASAGANLDVVGVLSNHPIDPVANFYETGFEILPKAEGALKTKVLREERILEVIQETGAGL